MDLSHIPCLTLCLAATEGKERKRNDKREKKIKENTSLIYVWKQEEMEKRKREELL